MRISDWSSDVCSSDLDAPKGGELKMSAPGTFVNLNPFIVKGTPAAAAGLIYDTLLARSLDEPTSMYGLVAESVEYPKDKSWVIFDLRPEARFQDGAHIQIGRAHV